MRVGEVFLLDGYNLWVISKFVNSGQTHLGYMKRNCCERGQTPYKPTHNYYCSIIIFTKF